jgi:hypothetical protein
MSSRNQLLSDSLKAMVALAAMHAEYDCTTVILSMLAHNDGPQHELRQLALGLQTCLYLTVVFICMSNCKEQSIFVFSRMKFSEFVVY